MSIENNGFSYQPTPISYGATPEEIAKWALQELEKLAMVVNNIAAGYCAPLTVAPIKPRTGMIRYADGTHWNPGSGAGYYGYDEASATWKFLG